MRTYPPMDRVPSVRGLGLVMNKYWRGGGGGGRVKLGTDSKGDSKIEHFSPYRPSLIDSYGVSILTFISCMEKEKGLCSIPYFHAIIDLHFVEHHSSCFCRSLFLQNSFGSLHSIFSCSSITSRKHGSQYATELPAFQPLDSLTFHHSRRQNKGYRSIPGTVNKYILHS